MVSQHIVAVEIPSTLEDIGPFWAHLPGAAAQRCGEG